MRNPHIVVLLASLWADSLGNEGAKNIPSVIHWGPVELSTSDATKNVKLIHEFIQPIYYARFAGQAPALPQIEFQEVWSEIKSSLQELAQLAHQLPALSFPIGIELYHWFFFTWRNGSSVAELHEKSLTTSTQLLLKSLVADSVCKGEGGATRDALEQFLMQGCDYRWTHLIMLEAELGREIAERRSSVAKSVQLLHGAQEHLNTMMQLPFFNSRRWLSPYDMNMNEEMYPSPGPVWPRSSVPLVQWLEEHYSDFRSDLDAILSEPELFDKLHQAERNAEGQDHAPEEDWTVLELADTREDEPWKERACAYAKRSCDLLRGRPEFQCNHAAVYINRMRPGASIKPHMGNPPRLVAHLGLDVPPDPIHLYVGNATITWQTGKAHVIDDTYIHSVRHRGLPGHGVERYILHMLLCHPCEPSQLQHYAGLGIRCSQ